MKTKLILALTTIWAIIAALNEAGLIDAIPIEDEQIRAWIKWITAVAVVLANMFWVKPEIVQKTINPTPKPPKPKK